MSAKFVIDKLRHDHAIDGFECWCEDLNRFLVRYAFVNQRAGLSQTYLGLAGRTVVGYYTLAVGQVAYDNSPQRVAKGMSRHPVPIMLLPRLAIRTSWQKQWTDSEILSVEPCKASI